VDVRGVCCFSTGAVDCLPGEFTCASMSDLVISYNAPKHLLVDCTYPSEKYTGYKTAYQVACNGGPEDGSTNTYCSTLSRMRFKIDGKSELSLDRSKLETRKARSRP
jgi:hypothetical protein